MTASVPRASNEAISVSIPPRKPKRPPVELGEVRTAVDELRRAGQEATLENIIARVGGSKGTISKHLQTLYAESQVPLQGEPSAVSTHVIRALAVDIERVVKERTGQLEGRLAEAHSSLKVLAQECEELHASGLETEELLETVRAMLAQQAGVSQALQDELRGKSEEAVRAHSAAEASRQSLALCEERLKVADEKNSLLEEELAALRLELAEAHRGLSNARLDLESARGATAALQAQLAAKQQLEEFLRVAADAGERYRQEHETTRQRLAATEAERLALQDRLDEAHQALTRSDGRTQQLLEKVLEGNDPRRAKDGKTLP